MMHWIHIAECFIKDGTLIRFLPSMYEAMHLQIASVCETLLFKVASLSECFLADGALVRFLPTVFDSMLHQDTYPSESFIADGTW
jgi:hypothetical protein